MSDEREDVRLIDTPDFSDFEDELFVLMQKKVASGMSHDEVMFTFARCAYRMATPETPPPAGQTYFIKITGRSNCGCLLEVEVGDCARPDDYEDDGGCHEPAN